jgi:hypothetical protein
MKRRFILVDHSLGASARQAYHVGYDAEILDGADARGMETVVATNVACPPLEFLRSRTVLRAFAHAAPWPSDLALAKSGQRRRWAQSFAAGCKAVFERVVLRRGDIVFLPMVSGHDLLGLARFLREITPPSHATWHAQFHYAPKDADRSALRRALDLLHNRGVSLYSTNDRLTDRLNALRLATFHTLPHPAGASMRPSRRTSAHRPLRLVVAGMSRQNKRYAFTELLAAVRRYLIEGRVRLFVQQKERAVSAGPWRADPAPVVVVPFPLPPLEYVGLVRESDIGLLPYDPWAFATRASGVLNEMLACGVPVLLPARSAPAEIVERAIQAYRKGIVQQREPYVRRRVIERSALDMPLPATPPGHLFVRAEWKATRAAAYVRVSASFVNAKGERLGAACEDLAGLQRGRTARAIAVLNLPASAARARIHVRCTHGTLRRLTAELRPPGPKGALGCVFSDPRQIPEALQDLIDNLRHYRETALAFSGPWRRAQSAHALLRRLSSVRR